MVSQLSFQLRLQFGLRRLRLLSRHISLRAVFPCLCRRVDTHRTFWKGAGQAAHYGLKEERERERHSPK